MMRNVAEGNYRITPANCLFARRNRVRGRLSLLLCFLGCLLVFCPSSAQCQLYLDLENPNLAKIPIAVPDFVAQSPAPLNGRDLARIIKNDLYLTVTTLLSSPPSPQNPMTARF
jgi:hypothetical protein